MQFDVILHNGEHIANRVKEKHKYIVYKSKPLTNIIIITNYIDLVEKYKFKVTIVYIDPDFYKDKKTIQMVADDFILFEKLCDLYVLCMDEESAKKIINMLCLDIVIVDKEYLLDFYVAGDS